MTDTTYPACLSAHSPQTVSEAFRTLARLVGKETLSLPGRVLQTLVVWQQRADSRTRLTGMENHLCLDAGLTPESLEQVTAIDNSQWESSIQDDRIYE